MTHCRGLLLATLVYLTLDVSLVAMPGAFVFEPDESVESTRIRARAAAGTIVPPAPPRDALLPSHLPVMVKDRLTPALSVERHEPPVPRGRARTPHDPAPPSEDPH